MASFHTCHLVSISLLGKASHSEILLLSPTMAPSGLDQNYSHFADEKTEAQGDCIQVSPNFQNFKSHYCAFMKHLH